MILNIFILVLVVEIIANKPPSQYWSGGANKPPSQYWPGGANKPPSQYWPGGPKITKYRCQPGKKLWCSKEYPPPPNPLIPPIKRDRGPPKDG